MKKRIAFLFLLALLSCSNENQSVIRSSGTVEAKEITVSSEVSGKIIALFFDEGDKVDSSNIICQVDTELTYQRYLEARALMESAFQNYQLLLKGARPEEIQAMEEAVNRARANFENAERQFKRVEKLFNDGVTTQEQFENAKTFYETSKAQYEEAKKRLEILKKGAREEEIKIAFANYNRALAVFKSAEIQLKKSKILAPASGVIVTKYVEVGEFISAGTPIVKLANLDEVFIRIYIPEKDLGKIKLNDTVEVKVDSHPEKVFRGVITFISPEAEFTPKNVQTKDERVKLVYAVKVKVKNPERILKPGMPADVEIKMK